MYVPLEYGGTLLVIVIFILVMINLAMDLYTDHKKKKEQDNGTESE